MPRVKKTKKQKFYFKRENVKNKPREVRITVYKSMVNGLKKIGTKTFSMGSTKGVKSEALDVMVKKKGITQSRVKTATDGYYTWQLADKGNFTIEEI